MVVAERGNNVVTDAASPDVVVRVRRGVVPIRAARTGVRALVPVAPQDNGEFIQPTLSEFWLSKIRAWLPLRQAKLMRLAVVLDSCA